MTKKGRVPDAYSGGFLSTIESTGAGSSGLTGQGSMNISNHRDSSTTSKKWMKLLSALRVQVVPLYKISFTEKQKWLLQLTMELDKVRGLGHFIRDLTFIVLMV
ncbi:unnamed protein product [Lactuca saligna]|uniref:Uncharacterized protein n=1 Tax=Lactuca saligna TaxID=75948 RepID=A0AA35YF53_LACSI|nr:unnamed protein product [Lactuca saligna]